MFRKIRRRDGSISGIEIVQVTALEASLEELEPWEAHEPLATLVHLGHEALDCVRSIPVRLHLPEGEDILAAAVSAFLVGIMLGRFFR